jgi:hypothetical protein
MRRAALALAAALAMGAAAASVQAADRPFCEDYARRAANQAHRARDHGRCEAAVRHDEARWRLEFKDHFDWCMAHSRKDADAERAARRETLAHCAH